MNFSVKQKQSHRKLMVSKGEWGGGNLGLADIAYSI